MLKRMPGFSRLRARSVCIILASCWSLVVSAGMPADRAAAAPPREGEVASFAAFVRAVEWRRCLPWVPVDRWQFPTAVHVVQDGDTLLDIALVYGVELDDLVQLNGLADPHSLSIGQPILIPPATELETAPPPPSSRGGQRTQMIRPTVGGISTYFGEEGPAWKLGWHTGVDFAASYGEAIYAVLDGIVIEAEDNWAGLGNYVKIDHGDGLHTLYAHLSRRAVEVGDRVVQGEPIGRVGETGFAFGPHLHFEVRVNGEYRDPLPFLGIEE